MIVRKLMTPDEIDEMVQIISSLKPECDKSSPFGRLCALAEQAAEELNDRISASAIRLRTKADFELYEKRMDKIEARLDANDKILGLLKLRKF